MSLLKIEQLNQFIEDKSYIEGFVQSQADVAIYEAHKSAVPDSKKFPHAARWFNHIASFKDMVSFPGQKKAADSYGPPISVVAVEEDDDDELDLFGEDEEEDAANEALKASRVAEYNAKKANKPKTIAKSIVMLDVKPWDDETDLKEMENQVRSITQDGLLWGASKLIAIGYGIKKLQIACVIEDDKVSTDDLQESIAAFEDFVQSTDVVSFNKI